MSTLTITRGLPASGKTTFAREWVDRAPTNRVRVNRDDLRTMMFGRGSGLDRRQEHAVTLASRSAVRAALDGGRDVIADDMNLRPCYVRQWRRFTSDAGHALAVVELPVTVEESIERDRARGGKVGPGHPVHGPLPRRRVAGASVSIDDVPAGRPSVG